MRSLPVQPHNENITKILMTGQLKITRIDLMHINQNTLGIFLRRRKKGLIYLSHIFS